MLKLFLRDAGTPFFSEFRRWLTFAGRLVFWPLLALTLFALALALGVKKNEFVFHGPFQAETNPPQRSVAVNLPAEAPARWWREPMLGDTMANPYRSFLRVRINDREIGPPHCQHANIRTRETQCFSHWGSAVLFRFLQA